MNSDIKCFKCHNFGNKAYECRIRLEPLEKNKNEIHLIQHVRENSKVWQKKKEEESNTSLNKENNIALHVQNKSNGWYVDSGCSSI